MFCVYSNEADSDPQLSASVTVCETVQEKKNGLVLVEKPTIYIYVILTSPSNHPTSYSNPEHITSTRTRSKFSQVGIRVHDALALDRVVVDFARGLRRIVQDLFTYPFNLTFHSVSFSKMAIFHVRFLLRHELRHVVRVIFFLSVYGNSNDVTIDFVRVV